MLAKIREYYSKTRISKNTAPKLLSIFAAVVFWLYVMNQVNPEIIRDLENIPVKLIGVDELKSQGFEIMGETDFMVDVKVKGRRNEVLSVASDNIEIIADLRGYDKKGINNITLIKPSYL